MNKGELVDLDVCLIGEEDDLWQSWDSEEQASFLGLSTSYVDTALMPNPLPSNVMEDDIVGNEDDCEDDLGQGSTTIDIMKQDDQDPYADITPGTILDPTPPTPTQEQSDVFQEHFPIPDHLFASTTPKGDGLTSGQVEIPPVGSTTPLTGVDQTNPFCSRTTFDGDKADELVTVPGDQECHVD